MHLAASRPLLGDMTSHRRTRVVVVDRFRLVTQVLDLALSPECDGASLPVHPLHSTPQVLDAILRRPIEVVVLGDALGGSINNVLLVERLTARGIRVVALAPDDVTRMRLARAGAVATALVADGVAGVRDALARALGDAVAGEDAPQGPVLPDPRDELLRRLDLLTRREVDVLALVVRGRTATEIAREHVVSEMTVRSQLKSILHKLEVPCQLAAVALAKEAAWEAPPVRAA